MRVHASGTLGAERPTREKNRRFGGGACAWYPRRVALEPSRITDFRIAGSLGVGSTARVFEAVHLPSGRPVAIKMIEPGHDGSSELRERFAREALLLANVQSRHVSQILGFGFERGQPFIVLERLTGETLDAKVRRDGPIPMTVGMDWIEQLLMGVRDVHAANVVHRDLKPSNVFVQEQSGAAPVVKVIDFGVARLCEVAGSPGLTSTHHLIGSMGYMAPEQFKSAHLVGFAADIYALGVLVFRMATGRLPFVSRSIEQIIRMKMEKEPPLVSSMEGAPRCSQLDWFVGKAMQRDPADRFKSVREMLDAWQRVMPVLRLGADEELITTVDSIRIQVELAEPSERPGSPGPEDDHEPTIPERRVSFATMPDLDPGIAAVLESSRTDPGIPVSPAAVSPSRFPSAESIAAGVDLDGPTRSDPELRRLVERELERARAKRNPT